MAIHRHFLIAATSGVVLWGGAVAAFAQPPEQPPFGGPQFSNSQAPQNARGKIGQKLANPQARSQRLHNQLGITAGQEQAFNAWITATAPPAGPPADQGLTTPQRLDRRVADITARANAAKRLYAALTPEQKQTFDNLPPEVALGQPGPAGALAQAAQQAQAQGKGAGRAGRAGRLARRNGAQPGPADPNNPAPPQPGGYNPQ